MEYISQICQDNLITQKFRTLHHQIVNAIIQFCKENNVEIDEFHLNADGVLGSIPYGKWGPCTDSCLEFYDCDGTPYLISMLYVL